MAPLGRDEAAQVEVVLGVGFSGGGRVVGPQLLVKMLPLHRTITNPLSNEVI